jgi:hypothetical protein
LERKVTDLDFQNQDLSKKLNEERAARTQAAQQNRQKDSELQTLRSKSKEFEKAFQNAEKRNRELERVLNDLESRLKEMECKQTLASPEAGFVEFQVNPPSNIAASPAVTSPLAPVSAAVISKEETKTQEAAAQKSTEKPAARPPKPSLKRKWFPFLGRKDHENQKNEKTKLKQEAPAREPVKTEGGKNVPPPPTGRSKLEPAPPLQVKEKTQAAEKTDQAISAGRVLLVNRKFNFIVVNLGTHQGLTLDDVLTVQKNGNPVAKVRVEKLYDDYSAAYIIEEQSAFPIGEQDVVTAV